MIQFTQFPFLQALGYAILNSLWQFALLWLVYLLINCIFQLSPHKKYATALTLQLAGFSWFITTLLFYYQKCAVLAQSGIALSEISDFGYFDYSGSVRDTMRSLLLRAEMFLPYLALAYLVLLVVFGIKWIGTFSNTQRLKVQGLEKIDYHFRLFVEKISLQFAIKKPVRVYLSSLVKSPLTVGFLKPVILLPVATVNYLTYQQVEAILLHELAHIKRYDYVLNLLLSLIEISLFFNPFMQLIYRHIKRERENSCDDWVLQYEYNVSDYAGALLKLARNNQKMVPVLAMNAVNQKNSLLIRVKRMIEKQDRTFNYRNQLLALVFISGMLSVLAWFTPKNSRNIAKQATPQLIQPSKNIEPLVATVDNPLFNPVFFLVENQKRSKESVELSETATAKEQVTIIALTPAVPPGPKAPGDAVAVENAENAPVPAPPTPAFNPLTFTLDRVFATVDSLSVTRDLNIQTNNLRQDLSRLESERKLINRKGNLSATAEKHLKVYNQAALQNEIKGAIAQARVSLKNSISEVEQLVKDKRLSRLIDTVALRLEKSNMEQQLRELEQAKQHWSAVSFSPQVSAATAWKNVEEPTMIFFAPQREKEHTFSYDYKEDIRLRNGKASTSARAKYEDVDVDGDEEDSVEVPEEKFIQIILSPGTTKQKNSTIVKKRVLKITRI